jgi:uncharacterized membrane protein
MTWFILAGCIALTAWCYPNLPAVLATHWNAAGRADGFMQKQLAVVVMPLMMLFITILFSVLPYISPRGFGTRSFSGSVHTIAAAVVLFLALAHGLILARGLGIPVDIKRWTPAALGVLFIVLGNLLGKTTKNFFIGIRTPWTLASDEVWYRTHRLGGKMFVLSGLAMLVCAALGGSIYVTLLLSLPAAIVPIVYSYLVYRQLEAGGSRSV